jgi:cobalt-zinc-cadmium efflux system membrane fusion protein
MGSETVVFVRTAEGFERREVVLGRRDERGAEVVFGLDAGETIAVTNTFVLKAELGKSEAAHGHAH